MHCVRDAGGRVSNQSYVAPVDGAISVWQLVTDLTDDEIKMLQSIVDRWEASDIRVWVLQEAKNERCKESDV